MTPDPARLAAARMLQATNPKHVPLKALRMYERFASEALAEAGAAEVANVVRQMRLHSALSRRLAS